MTAIPIEADLAGPGATESQFQGAIAALRKVVVELPGAGPAQTLTLNSDIVIPVANSGVFLIIDTEASAATDNCSNIQPTNCRDGHLIFVSAANVARAVTLKHLVGGSGQLDLSTAGDVVLDDPDKVVCLRYSLSSDVWIEVFRSWTDNAFEYATDTSGSANTITIAPQPPIKSYKAGQRFTVKVANGVTGATVVGVNGLTNKNLMKMTASGLAALSSGDLKVGQIIEIEYDGTQFQLLSPTTPGTNAGQVVALDGTAKLPAVDGSQLANLPIIVPRGHLAGIMLSRPTATTITFSAGMAADSSGTYLMTLGVALTKTLQATGPWAAGTGQNGLFSGAKANSTWYHCFIIRKDSDGSVDCGFDTSVVAANRPAGYSNYRRIGSIRTDGSGSIRDFNQTGDLFYWKSALVDDLQAAITSAPVSYALTVPSGVKVEWIGHTALTSTGGETRYALWSPDMADLVVGDIGNSIATVYTNSAIPSFGLGPIRILTDTNRSIRGMAASTGGTLHLHTVGWVDTRGRFD